MRGSPGSLVSRQYRLVGSSSPPSPTTQFCANGDFPARPPIAPHWRVSWAHFISQLAFRVSSTSVTVITPGAGCSITSAATVSTTGATGRFTFLPAFFTGAGLGLALATVRFVAFPRADLATLRALPRAVALFLFCAFDCFLRLAMIRPSPGWWSATHDVGSMSLGNPSNELSPDFSSSAP
jgi:hypothetical protein